MRQSREAKRRDLENRHTLNLRNGYAAWGCCSRCRRFAYVAGKTYERKVCRDCAVNPGGVSQREVQDQWIADTLRLPGADGIQTTIREGAA